MSITTKKRRKATATEMIASASCTLEISPSKAASARSTGRNKKVIATPEEKTTAVKASIGNFVLISNSQIKTIPKITKGNAPNETSKP